MEFLLFLSSTDKEILELIYKANFKVEENTPLCLLGKRFFGFLKRKQKTVVICTRNAMDIGGYWLPKSGSDDKFNPTHIYIRKALRHEATHVAQLCNNGNKLNMMETKNMKLHPYKQKALKGSVKLSGSKEREYEAYLLEDKPRLVKYALRKYCL